MDDINQKISNLSLGANDLQSAIAEWLQTDRGSFYKQSFYNHHLDLINKRSFTIFELKRFLLGFDEPSPLGGPMKNMLYQVDCRGKPRRELCDDKTFEDLVKAGDCAQFLMNAWVDISAGDEKGELLASSRKDDAQRLDKAFHQDFQGNNVHWIEAGFAEYKEMYDANKHYGKMVPVLQSSGTGKSRTMAQWAKTRLILSVCFRDVFEDMQSEPRLGWPPGDKPVCKFFASPPRPTRTDLEFFKGEELAGAFLGAMYDLIADLLEETTVLEPRGLENFYASWTFDNPANVEESLRYKNFAKVCAIAEQRLKENETAISKNREDMEAKRAENPSPQRGSEAGTPLAQDEEELTTAQQARSQGITAWHDSIFNLLVKEWGKKLLDICQKSELSPDFIVVLDECSELDRCNRKTSANTTPISDMSLLAMQRIIKAGDKFHDIWFFLLDTSSGILDLHPQTGPEARSLRLRRGFVPLPLWLYFQYDVMLSKRVRPMTPLEATSIDNLKWYGRPYWSTLQESDLLTAAEEKLLCGKHELKTSNHAQVLAIFSARLVLELGTDEASTTIAIESVRSHMRILTGFKNSKIITTCAPSEPILAAAATSLLLKNESGYQGAVKTLVNSMILQGIVIDKGHRGELIARILIMLARDSAVLGLPKGSRPAYCIPLVSLCEFLKAFLGKNMAIHAPNEQQKNLREGLEEWAQSHYLNFTHFIQLSQTIDELSADFLMECWCRGVALVCSSGQPVFDLLLITYKGSLTESFDKSLFGLVSIQVKLRAAPAPSRIVGGLTCPIVLIEGGDEHRKPEHLAIFMDLGATAKFRGSGGYCNLTKEPATKPRTSDSTQNWKGYVGEDEPSRYCINIRHHTHAQYPAIGQLGPDLDDLWEGPYPSFINIVDEMEFGLDPLRGKLLATTEDWFKAQNPNQEEQDVYP